MRNPSPKARQYIGAGLDLLQNQAAIGEWQKWAAASPFQRTEGPVNQSLSYLPRPIALIALDALNALAKKISQNLQDRSLGREAMIALRNDLSFIQDIETELHEDIRERV